MKFFLSFWGRHQVSAIGTLMDFDARDVDLPTREQEGVSGGAALEINAAAVLAGPWLRHGDSVAQE